MRIAIGSKNDAKVAAVKESISFNAHFVTYIYDGANYAIGLSTGFELPPQILDLVLNHKMNLTQACLHSGISQNTKIGSTEGLVGVLTSGKIDRKEYSKQCVQIAMIQLENADWYRNRSRV